MPKPGDQLVQDPNAVLLYVMDWTLWLPSGETIVSSDWEVDRGDGTLTLDNETIMSGSLKTRVRISGGTEGRKYVVRNRISTSGSPQQTDDRSFTLLIAPT